MGHVPHELRAEFPEFVDKIHALKISNNHFTKLADEYHEVNRQIHRAEIGEDHLSQFNEEELRKKRMTLKDEIYAMLKS